MIESHPTWQTIDSSKLATMSTCWRKDFFENILGWRSEIPSQDAYFGEGWHHAREHMLLNGYDSIDEAYHKFLAFYREEYDESTDELYGAKVPAAVLNALVNFAVNYPRDLYDNELLYTEISGSVPVDRDRVVYFRMDSVLRRKSDGKIFSWDHKTTKKFSRSWEDQFALSWQSGTYTHCLYCMFPIEEVLGIEFCGTQFEYLSRSSKYRGAGYHSSFRRVPAWKSKDQMQAWLWNCIDMLDKRTFELDRLMNHCKESDKVLMAFPMNPESCTKYWGCQWHDYCLSWPNPLQHCWEPPLGFKQEFWDPTKIQTSNKMELQWPTT
jgi:hypothetical protein